MNVTAQDVMKLREVTGAGPLDCKSALTTAASFEEAVKIIEQKGQKRAEKVKGQDRETLQGAIVSYIHHGNNLGVLLEVNCSTDFVARNEDFRTLAKEIAIQIAGMAPEFISFADIPADVLAEARRAIAEDPEVMARPERVRDQIIEGKIKKQFGTKILLEQPWVKDETKTMGTLLDDVIRKTGENIVIRRFTRYVLGEQLSENAATPALSNATAEPASTQVATATKAGSEVVEAPKEEKAKEEKAKAKKAAGDSGKGSISKAKKK